MIVRTLVVGQLATNCYLLTSEDSSDTYIVDPGDDGDYIVDKIVSLNLHPTAILATHGHFDHILAAGEISQILNIPFYIHKNDIFLVETCQNSVRYFLGKNIDVVPIKVSGYLVPGKDLVLGNEKIEVMATPGHTPGGICLYVPTSKFTLVGDTIFAGGSIGRTDHKYSSESDMKTSLNKILNLPRNTKLYPGHGEETTVESEIQFH